MKGQDVVVLCIPVKVPLGLLYIVSFRPVGLQGDIVSKNQNKTKQKTTKDEGGPGV